LPGARGATLEEIAAFFDELERALFSSKEKKINVQRDVRSTWYSSVYSIPKFLCALIKTNELQKRRARCVEC